MVAWVVFAAKYKGQTCTKGVSYYGHGVTGGVVNVLGAESLAAHENNWFYLIFIQYFIKILLYESETIGFILK